MISNGYRFRVGVSLVLGLTWTSAAVGDGPLFPGAQYAVGVAPQSVAIGDLNGDQAPDLAVANFGSDNVTVLLGLGDGTVDAAMHYGVANFPNYPVSIAIGDLNGDQAPDLAVAKQGTNPAYDDASVSVLLGIGDGTFHDAVHFATGDRSWSVAIGDLNGDQRADLAVANASSDNLSVLLGFGDGTFAAAVNYAAGNAPNSVAIGDLNGDQMPDLGVCPSNEIRVHARVLSCSKTRYWMVKVPSKCRPSNESRISRTDS